MVNYISQEPDFSRFEESLKNVTILVLSDDEKISQINNLRQLSWLREGLRKAQTVCRILTDDGAIGTGWLIANDKLITNNHVINEKNNLTKCRIEFNYEKDWKGNDLEVDTRSFAKLLTTSDNLDYSILSLNDKPGEKYGFVNLLDAVSPSMSDPISLYPVIIQHPYGQHKQISLTDNHLKAINEDNVWYTTDTQPGSSGSPVFDQKWRPIALHHAGGRRLLDGKEVLLNEGMNLLNIISDAKDILHES